jgi:hypothetical protein
MGTLALLWRVEAVVFESYSRVGSVLNGGRAVDSPAMPPDLTGVVRQLASGASNVSNVLSPTTIEVPAAVPKVPGTSDLPKNGKTPSSSAEMQRRRVHAERRNHPDLMTSGLPAGAGSLRISNRTGVDAAITVRSETAPRTPLTVIYVSADKTVVVDSVGPGSYVLKVEAGTGWDPNTLRFGNRTFAHESVGPFRFTQIQSSEGLQSDHRELVLTPGP